MRYVSTRGEGKACTASEAIIKGLADDGGLFVPESFPHLTLSLSDLEGKNYKETAYEVMKLFFDDFTEEELKGCIEKAYDDKFDTKEIAPLSRHDGQYFLELFHGPTIAFKDMALSILPHLLTCALKKNHIDDKVVIMTATSGDTGKAALAAFADVENTQIIVFYPKGGVSRIQELQMITQKGDNTKVVGVEGNFDDCQTGVKKMFNDPELKSLLASNGYRFSSANSINIGRLIPQVAYYVYSYVKMREMHAVSGPLSFVVPTGNFGNILAAFYAKKIGVPIGKLICASNENKVLFDFFRSGTYDRNREFILTTSPSMDILISSNLERLIYHSLGDDAKENARLMKELASSGKYSVSAESRQYMDDFVGIYANEQQVAETIKRYYESCGYVIDPHTAVAAYANLANKKNDPSETVIISTASPYKFVSSVLNAIAPERVTDDDFEMADVLNELSHTPIPDAVTQIRNAAILHDGICTPESMRQTVTSWLAI